MYDGLVVVRTAWGRACAKAQVQTPSLHKVATVVQ